jgi:hypothetical protein
MSSSSSKDLWGSMIEGSDNYPGTGGYQDEIPIALRDRGCTRTEHQQVLRRYIVHEVCSPKSHFASCHSSGIGLVSRHAATTIQKCGR